MLANSDCRYFARLHSLKNAVSFSKVPKIILWGAGCVGAQYIFRKYLKLLHYSHFYFAFNTHDIWKLFFLSKICQQKVSDISRLSKKPKSRSAQFQNLIFNERWTLFSPLKYINFILLAKSRIKKRVLSKNFMHDAGFPTFQKKNFIYKTRYREQCFSCSLSSSSCRSRKKITIFYTEILMKKVAMSPRRQNLGLNGR